MTTPARIRSASLSGYLELAQSLGLPARQMLRAAGIDPRSLDDPEALIDVPAVRQLLEASAAAAGIEDFGLRLVASRRLSNLGPLSLVLRDEPTGRRALETLCGHMRLLNESLLTRIEDAGDLVIIREEILFASPGSIRQSMELAVGVLHRLLRDLIGPHWQARRVCFTHRAPADLATHLRVFGRFVAFNAEFNGIVCAAADLERPIGGADPGMALLARRYLDGVLQSHSAPMKDEVRRLVLASLPGGRCSVDEIARHLGVDRRTIHRRLARDGVTFSSLLEQARRELALRHIDADNRPLQDIAGLLGFSAQSAFSRWFRAAFGMSVRDWRARRT